MENDLNQDYDEIKQMISEIKDWHKEIFEISEDKMNIKEEVESFIEDFEENLKQQNQKLEDLKQFYSKTFEDTPLNKSYNTLIKENIKEIKTDLDDIKTKQISIDEFYDEIFKGDNQNLPIKTVLQGLVKQFSANLDENEKKLAEIRDYYDKVFVDTKTKDNKDTFGLKSTVEELKNRLEDLIENAEHKLHALTDSSLHNAFAVRADEYTKEFRKLQNYTFFCTLAIILDLIVFALIQFFNKNGFDYHLLIYQFSIAGALVYAIWMFNRNQKIAKKLAEEYHHKASLAEAMTGYRKLYGLKHQDEEYMELFDSIKDQLNINPSKRIDNFLDLKSPQEELTSKLSEIADPKVLIELAKQIKPLLDKV